MTLGQRIQELRKKQGLSQEGLGEALGVSRQAVSKWESDKGIPELDTIIAMSRLFSVTVGQLLGVEEPQEQPDVPEKQDTSPLPARVDPDPIEAVLHRYVEETAKREESPWYTHRVWLIAGAVTLAAVFVVLFAQLSSLRSTVKLLRNDLYTLRDIVSLNQQSLSGQIRNTIYEVLAEEEQMLSTFRWEVTALDVEQETATLQLSATMKEYTAGSRLQICAAWQKVDESRGESSGDWAAGPNFRSELTLPLNMETELSIRVEDAEGNIREQLLPNPIYELHPDNIHLSAYNLTVPFAVTVSSFGVTSTTAKAEQTGVEIVSVFPDFIRPEQAVLTACVNGTEILHEDLAIRAGREENVFLASLGDGYENGYMDLTLKEGDTLEVTLRVTDNLGRTETFTEHAVVEEGWLERPEASAPVVTVG